MMFVDHKSRKATTANSWLAMVVALSLTISGCASIERCNAMGGTVIDLTALTISSNGELLAGGTHYKVENCAFEEFIRQSGRRTPKGLLLAISGDDGKTWNAKQIPLPTPEKFPKGYELRGLASGKDGSLLVGINHLNWVGFEGGKDFHSRLLRSVDGGISWKQAFDFGSDRLLNIVAPSNSVVLASLCERGLIRSEDDGETWTQTGLKRIDNNSCASPKVISNSSGQMYAYAWGRNGPGFYRSADDGLTWTRLPIPVKGRAGRIAANNKGDVVATTSGPWQQEIYLSGDHGMTWKQARTPYEFWTEQLGVATDGSILVKAMDNLLAPDGGSYISTDHGESWTRLNNRWTGENSIPGSDSIVTAASGRLFVRKEIDFNGLPSSWGWGGTLYYSQDSGRSWHTINPIVERVPE